MTTFRKINNWLHLWLGLISGIIVFIVCVTGCIWVFNEEITAFLEPEGKVERQERPVLTPSQIRHRVTALYPGKEVSYAMYHQGRAVEVQVGGRKEERYAVLLNPYTGEVLRRDVLQKDEVDFFRFILNGHRFLWLPWKIGRPIVNYGTMIFVVLLITGLIWWYPKKWTKSTVDKSFKIKWNASFKRVNLDLHNVLGFYSLLFLLAIALTGMVWGINWYSEGLYWVTSGGETLSEWPRLQSDTLQVNRFYTKDQAMDKAWSAVLKENPKADGFYYSYPDDAKAPISIIIYPSAGVFYDNRGYAFDQHTLKRLPRNAVYDASYEEAGFGAKLRRMNYDIHVGAILGFPGKVLAFLASLIGASLPVTGFLIWWGRKKKTKKDSKTARPARPAGETSTLRRPPKPVMAGASGTRKPGTGQV